jgi:hypothetical protein
MSKRSVRHQWAFVGLNPRMFINDRFMIGMIGMIIQTYSPKGNRLRCKA